MCVCGVGFAQTLDMGEIDLQDCERTCFDAPYLRFASHVDKHSQFGYTVTGETVIKIIIKIIITRRVWSDVQFSH